MLSALKEVLSRRAAATPPASRRAGFADARVAPHHGNVRFASIDLLVSTERAWLCTVGGQLDDAQFERLRAESQGVLAPFVAASGEIAFPMPALIVSA